jgi:hypothetical protein
MESITPVGMQNAASVAEPYTVALGAKTTEPGYSPWSVIYVLMRAVVRETSSTVSFI